VCPDSSQETSNSALRTRNKEEEAVSHWPAWWGPPTSFTVVCIVPALLRVDLRRSTDHWEFVSWPINWMRVAFLPTQSALRATTPKPHLKPHPHYQQITIPKSKMTPSSFPDRNLSPNQDVSTLNCDTLSAIRELDKMMAETINAVFKCRLFRHFTLSFFAC